MRASQARLPSCPGRPHLIKGQLPKCPGCLLLNSWPGRQQPSRSRQKHLLRLRRPKQSCLPCSLPSATGIFLPWGQHPQVGGGAQRESAPHLAALQQPRPRCLKEGCHLSQHPPALLCPAGALLLKQASPPLRCAICPQFSAARKADL